MKEIMVLSKIEHINPFKVVGYDSNGNCWTVHHYKTRDMAINGTKELLMEFGREHYPIEPR